MVGGEGLRKESEGQARQSVVCIFQGKVAQDLEKVSIGAWGVGEVSESQDIYLTVLNLCSIKNLLMTNSVSMFFRESAKCPRKNSQAFLSLESA